MKQWDLKTLSICLAVLGMAVSATLWFNSSINGVRSDIVESQYQTTKVIAESESKTAKAIAEVRVKVAESESKTTKAIAESESKTTKAIAELRHETTKVIGELRHETTKAIAELRGELGALNTRVDSLEEKVEGVIEHLRNRDAQTAPKDTSTLDLEETSP